MQKVPYEITQASSTRRVVGLLPDPGSVVIASGASSSRRLMAPALAAVLAGVQQELGLAGGAEGVSLSSVELENLVQKIAQRLGFELSNFERDEILAEVEKNQRPFGPLQELVDDNSVSDVIVTDYSTVAIQQGRKNFSTGVSFPSQEAYEVFVEKLLQKAGTSYSTKKPIADGMIGAFARVHAVHKSICETGPYLTIRLNRFSRVAIDDLINCGLAPREVLSYLIGNVLCGQTLLIVGEVGTGKTTLARALAASIPSTETILVIEDTREIVLEHPHVRYLSTREANLDGAGRVAPAECIRASMRMAMNRIIFGEMRDAEAAEAFIDVCASGHPGLSTVHARSAMDAVSRLELFLGRAQRGVARHVLTEQIATAVQILVHVDVCRQTGRRRIMEVREIGPVAEQVLRQREIFRYDAQQGTPRWRVVSKVSAQRAKLEELPDIVDLAGLPPFLELAPEIALKEVASDQFRHSRKAA